MRNPQWNDGPPLEVLVRFCELARLVSGGKGLSLRQVAKKMEVSASFVSDILANLEAYYKVQKLVDRSGGGRCTVTPEGRALSRLVARCVEEYERVKANTSIRLREQVIRIGGTTVFNDFLLPAILKEARKDWDAAANIDIEFRDEMSASGRLEHLRQGHYDLVIDVAGEEDVVGVRCRRFKLVEIPPWLLLPPRAASGPIRFSKLRGDQDEEVSIDVLGGYPLAVADNAPTIDKLPVPDRENGCQLVADTSVSVVHHVMGGDYVGVAYAWPGLIKRWKEMHRGLEARRLGPGLPNYRAATFTAKRTDLPKESKARVEGIERIAHEVFQKEVGQGKA